MKTHALLSAQGRDRIGVADDLSAEMSSRRLHIEDGRMTALGGQFALIVQVRGKEEDVARLRRDLPRVSANLGFELQLGPASPLPPSKAVPEYSVECFSQGPGGMSAVTGLLKRNQVNIESLETEASAAPWTSRMTFHLTARITLPESCSVEKLREELRELERERNLDIIMKADKPVSYSPV